jgi:uncharacterized protein (TIGR03437 family)
VTGIAADSAGNLYLAGTTLSSDFPVTPGAFQTKVPNIFSASFVAKLNPSGSALIYASYLGGSTFDSNSQLRVDSQGQPVLFGTTESKDFPVTPDAFQLSLINVGYTGYVTKFNTDGTGLVFSTFIDGSFGFAPGTNPAFTVGGFDMDSNGNVFLAGGTARGFPATKGATQSCMAGGFKDMFIAELSPSGKLIASTYLGGSGIDNAQAIVANTDGTVVVAGSSSSTDFPITTGAQPGGNYIVARLVIADPSQPDPPCMAEILQNAASKAELPVAPGELVTISGNHFGPDTGVSASADGGFFPTQLAGARVYFDDVPAPLLYVQSEQINVQAPFELSGHQTTSVRVEYQGVSTAPVPIVVRDASPDFFMTAAPPQGVIFNQDGTPNSDSNPAAIGSTVWILGTGGGVYSPPLPTGSIAPIAPLSRLVQSVDVKIDDGAEAQVVYAGSSPTAPSGVFQINFVVPQVAFYGQKHFVDVTIGSSYNNPLATASIAIHQ